MRMARVFLATVPIFLLAGCWMGTGLYAASDARPAIPAGTYRASEPGGVIKTYQVTALPNGLTQVDDGEDKIPYGFAPLDPGVFVAWLQMDDDSGAFNKTDPNQFYGLLIRQPEGSFVAYLPACKDQQAAIARKNGAAVQEGPSPECRFSSRLGLEKALRAYPRTGPGLELTPIPK